MNYMFNKNILKIGSLNADLVPSNFSNKFSAARFTLLYR